MTQWTYEGIVTKIYDGDTITVDLDMGLRVWQKKIEVRLIGINAPEIKGATHDAGIAARDYLRSLCPIGTTVQIVSYEYEKYGRLLGAVIADGIDLAASMLAAGHAVPLSYSTKDD